MELAVRGPDVEGSSDRRPVVDGIGSSGRDHYGRNVNGMNGAIKRSAGAGASRTD
jgi:hypothetical protein